MNPTYVVYARWRLEAYGDEYVFPTITYARMHARKLRKQGYRVELTKRTVFSQPIK